MKHEFKDELRIKVEHQHEHEIDPEAVTQVIDKLVEGTVIIIGVGTLAHFAKKIL